jgi:CheY-like chemotaxis protein
MPPGWDGAETVERIRAECPGVKFVICTAYSDIADDELRSRLGSDLVIVRKPFDPEQILSIVRGVGAASERN